MGTALSSGDEILTAIQSLDRREIERLLACLLKLRAERSAPSLSARETELLSRINKGLSESQSLRYHALVEKRRAGTLSPEEHLELLRLTNAAEAVQADRVRHLAELARLRGISLSSLVEELGLQPAPDV